MALATGMNAGIILMGLGIYAMAAGFIYRRPIPAQPMKVVAAMAIIGQIDQQTIIATGIILGFIVFLLGITGWISLLKKIVSSAVLLGIQTALAISLLLTAIPFIEETIIPALLLLVFFMLLKNSRAHPVAFISVFIISLVVYWDSTISTADAPLLELAIPTIHLPDINASLAALNTAVFPQLALTITNALLLPVVLAHDYYPEDKSRITENRLALSTGSLNILLTPFGAVPMCHGAGGLVAYHAAGGRSGLTVITLGIILFVTGLLSGPATSYYLALLPQAVFGILLLITATYMVEPRKLLNVSQVSGLTIIIVILTAIFYSILIGLIAGVIFEYAIHRIQQHYRKNKTL